MSKLNIEEIHLISKHSNWAENAVQVALTKNVYHKTEAWQKFIRLLLISLGVGFTTAGILFFFAYNWNNLHKFVKIGMMETLIIIATSIVLFSKFSLPIKNTILTAASILVGVLFAVFGQVYQTGANAYDFFLGWTFAVILWVIISNFAPLWLVFLLLINTTFILFTEQVAQGWSEVFVFLLLFLMNGFFLVSSLLIKQFKDYKIPKWFTNIIALAVVVFGTFGITFGLFDNFNSTFGLLIIAVFSLFGVGIYYGLKFKSGFYLAIISFGLVFIFTGFLIKISSNEFMFFVVSLFIIGSVTLVIKSLIDLQKKWNHE
ncbi:MAG: DUF2157 domain-containing protein [Flavobacteriaceae bacterium]|nr:DUF2157 domain-containing protein [Flavobacteriaceae bacterium]